MRHPRKHRFKKKDQVSKWSGREVMRENVGQDAAPFCVPLATLNEMQLCDWSILEGKCAEGQLSRLCVRATPEQDMQS